MIVIIACLMAIIPRGPHRPSPELAIIDRFNFEGSVGIAFKTQTYGVEYAPLEPPTHSDGE